MLVIVLLLFVEIAVSFDQAAADPEVGLLPTVCGFVFATLVTEFLLRGLGIRLPLGFRLPYYLLLGLIFLYPAVPVRALRLGRPEAIPWLLYLFGPIAAVAMLTLLPAIRRGPAYTRENGTPWLWPMYPWTIFVVLLVGLGLRTYSLPQAFDPVLDQSRAAAMEFSTVFQPYFVVPLVFAVAVLLLELGIVAKNCDAQKVALGLPFGAFLLSLPVTTIAGPDATFLARYTQLLGHPMYVTAIGLVAFAAVARLRRVRHAERTLVLALLVFAYTNPAGRWFAEVTHPWALVVAGGLIGLTAIRRRDTRRGVVSALCFLLAGHPWLQARFPERADRILVDLVAALAFAASLIGTDRFARRLRTVVAVAFPVAILIWGRAADPEWVGNAFWGRPSTEEFWNAWWRRGDLLPLLEQGGFVVASLVLAVCRTSVATNAAAAGSVFLGLATWTRIGWAILVRHPRWIAIRSLVAGFLLFAVAVLISITKAGALRWLSGRLAAWRAKETARS